MRYNMNKLESLFDKFARHKTAATVFSDVLDYLLASFRWQENGAAIQSVYDQLTSHPLKTEYAAFLQEIADQSEGFQDALGEFYMKCISGGRPGQYFTPETTAKMMVQSIVGASAQAGQTVFDPACKSGRMLLAAAAINRDLLFFGADPDPVCCKMCVANMLMNSLVGEVAQMDGLGNEFFRGYKLRIHAGKTHALLYFKEFTDPTQSEIVMRIAHNPIPPSNSAPPTGA